MSDNEMDGNQLTRNQLEDWNDWHNAYADENSELIGRMMGVRGHVAAVVAEAPPGPVTIVSICSGQAREVIGTMLVSPVTSGSPLTSNLLVRQPALDESTVLVSVPVEIGNFPPMLSPGDNVTVIVSPDATIVDAAPPRIVAEIGRAHV